MQREIITQIINDWDPIGLLDSGAPIDEYDLEIEEILLNMNTGTDDIELANIIYKSFKDKMGLSLNKLACLKYAMEISGAIQLSQ
ncbi:hypothetical protein [Paenibacillus sambharensis]|uniref:hypothetical protein n=1 Tax=Paenibacillus sambharensis TaxID=1803190 RepID=UPI001C651835|nr:hypothetical protein [Paenibacillus sambharensis]